MSVPLRPESVHLVAQMIRHSRGIINAVERFERTIPREDRAREIGSIFEFVRAAFIVAEKTLAASPDA